VVTVPCVAGVVLCRLSAWHRVFSAGRGRTRSARRGVHRLRPRDARRRELEERSELPRSRERVH